MGCSPSLEYRLRTSNCLIDLRFLHLEHFFIVGYSDSLRYTVIATTEADMKRKITKNLNIALWHLDKLGQIGRESIKPFLP